jgi:hypothetical protein
MTREVPAGFVLLGTLTPVVEFEQGFPVSLGKYSDKHFGQDSDTVGDRLKFSRSFGRVSLGRQPSGVVSFDLTPDPVRSPGDEERMLP